MKKSRALRIRKRRFRQRYRRYRQRYKRKKRWFERRLLRYGLIIVPTLLIAYILVCLVYHHIDTTKDKEESISCEQESSESNSLILESSEENNQIEVKSISDENITTESLEAKPAEYEGSGDISGIEKIKEKESEESSDTAYIEVPHTDEEVIMMEYIVECEAHDLSLEHKTIIACVIVNRYYSDLWDYDSISEVILAKKQFSSLPNYYNHYFEPDEDSIKAVESVLSGEIDRDEYSQGAVFFYNPDRSGGYIDFFENREYLFSKDGHRFFR